MWFLVRYLYLATVILCIDRPKVVQSGPIEKNFHFPRAVDGTRGSQNEVHDSNDSSNDNQGSGRMKSEFSRIGYNVPGEPGVDYPAYTRVPKTGFSCQGRTHGYYADVETGCQAFHICHSVVISSFICPIGSIFSQNLLTCEWWNKVNCKATDYSHQRIHDIDHETARNAHATIHQAERDAARRGKAIHVERQAESIAKFDSDEHRAIANSNAGFKPNIVDVALISKNFALPQLSGGSGFKFGDTDSSIVRIKQNYNSDSLVDYPISQSGTFVGDFQNSDPQNDRVSENNFQPSYAPTVPTVTTTTRRMYSPTVPTMHKRSTESYEKYVPNIEGAIHPYAHKSGLDPLTTKDSASYADGDQQLLTSRFSNINPLDFDSDIADRVELFRERPSSSPSNEKNGEAVSKPESATSNSEKMGQSNTVRNEENNEPDISQDRIPPLIIQIPRPAGSSGPPSINIADQIFTFDSLTTMRPLISQPSKPVGGIDGEQTPETPTSTSLLIPQIAQSAEPTRTQISGGVDAGGIVGLPPRIPSSVPQIPQSGVTDATDRMETSQSPYEIPPLIPQNSQPEIILETQNSATADDGSSFDVPPRIPPLIPQITLNVQTETSKSTDDESSLDLPFRIPPLIPQITQSEQTETSGSTGDESSLDLPSRIPPLIPQITQSEQTETSGSTGDESSFDLPSRIPPLIPQITQSGQTETSGSTGDESSLDLPSRIPPLIPQITQSGQTETSGSTGDESSLDLPSRIPPLIPQITQSEQTDTSGSTGDDSSLDMPSRIPPLITQTQDVPMAQFEQPSAVSNRTETTSTETPLQISQPGRLSGTQTSGTDGDKISYGSTARTPLFVPETSQFDRPLVVTNRDQFFPQYTRAPPSVPQGSESGLPVVTETMADSGDDLSASNNRKETSQSPQRTNQTKPKTTVFNLTSSSTESSTLPTSGHPNMFLSNVHPHVVQNGYDQESPCSTVQDDGPTLSQDHPGISLMLLPPEKKIPKEEGVSVKGSFSGTGSQYGDDLQSPMGEVYAYATAAPYPDSFTVSRGYLPVSTKPLISTTNKRIYNQKSASADDPSQFQNQDARRSDGKYQKNVSVDPLKRLISSAGSVHATKHKIYGSIRPNGIPSDPPIDLSEIQTSIAGKDDSTPYQFSVTVNGDENFTPSEDFIGKLLAQQENDHAVLDFGDLGDYEIIKSEHPDQYSEDLPAEPSFDLDNFFRNRQNEQIFNFQSQNLSPNEPNARNSDRGRIGVEAVHSGDHPRPFSFANDQNVGSQTRLASFDEFPVANPLYFPSDAQSDRSVDDGHLLKVGTYAEDINSSLRSLSDLAHSVFETRSVAISRAQILDELKKHFGQPLYYGGPGDDLSPRLAGGNIENKVEPKFANLEQYGVRNASPVEQQEVTTTSTPPKTSTTTSKAAETQVETEILPSLSFSLDSDDERRAYAEAVLRGFLADQPSASPRSKETPLYQRSSGN